MKMRATLSVVCFLCSCISASAAWAQIVVLGASTPRDMA